jgi:CPA1 family monovalent cation:H+ antiporter
MVYDLVEFILNSLVFVLIGLEVGRILRDPRGPPLRELLLSTALITGVLIAARFAWMFAGALLPRVLGSRVVASERAPRLATVTVLAWMGMRGGDSLVTALAVPRAVASGAPFPGRELIVAVTFSVILATLLLQGLTLKPLIGLFRVPADRTHENEENFARRQMAEAGDERLDALEREGVPVATVERVRKRHKHRSALELRLTDGENADHAESLADKRAEEELLRARREAVVKLRNEQVIDDEVLRHLERELDLEEMRLSLSVGHAAAIDGG